MNIVAYFLCVIKKVWLTKVDNKLLAPTLLLFVVCKLLCLSVCLSSRQFLSRIYICMSLCLFLSFCPSCRSLSPYLHVCLSVCRSLFYLSVSLVCTHMSFSLYVCLSVFVCLYVCLSVSFLHVPYYISVCLSFCLSIYLSLTSCRSLSISPSDYLKMVVNHTIWFINFSIRISRGEGSHARLSGLSP